MWIRKFEKKWIERECKLDQVSFLLSLWNHLLFDRALKGISRSTAKFNSDPKLQFDDRPNNFFGHFRSKSSEKVLIVFIQIWTTQNGWIRLSRFAIWHAWSIQCSVVLKMSCIVGSIDLRIETLPERTIFPRHASTLEKFTFKRKRNRGDIFCWMKANDADRQYIDDLSRSRFK
jgi:hypothetical protein